MLFHKLLLGSLWVSVSVAASISQLMGVNIIDLTSNYSTPLRSLATPYAGFDRFDTPKDPNHYYIVNTLDEIPAKYPEKLQDKSNRFLVKDSKSGAFYYKEEDAWVHVEYSDIEKLEYRPLNLDMVGCFDNSMGTSGGIKKSFSASYSMSYDRAVNVNINLIILQWLWEWEVEIGTSVSFKSSASCDIGEGEYGRLWATIYIGSTPEYRKTKISFIDKGGYEKISQKRGEKLSFILSKLPTATCSNSLTPC